MRILIVDDEPAVRFSLRELLEADGHEVRAAEHAVEALETMEAERPDLVLTDVRMPAVDGFELLDIVRRNYPNVAVAMITAHGNERMAVEALKRGAYDYLPKPFDNEEVRALVRRVAELLSLRAENARLREELTVGLGELVGGSQAMRSLFDLIRRVGPTDSTVLIQGESGTGKELVARALHRESRRADGPFVAVNCGAIPGGMVEGELFGHLRGAFTGADRDRTGVVRAAHGGTLFLDEIADLPSGAQAKLLRVLEEREVSPLGDPQAHPVDIRVLAATNRDLEEEARSGAFRSDLLYRIQVVTLTVAPLRDRRDDIVPLAVHLLTRLGTRLDRPVPGLATDARRALLAYSWPGNVRELRNVLERAMVLCEEEITMAELPDPITGASGGLSPEDAALAGLSYKDALQRSREEFDRAFLGAALKRNDGNVSRTARALGMHRQTLQKLLRRTRSDE
ncbi:MAG: sigma-54 dependent transcriptional regulator [Gemmatimonadota bacterium]|jgi:two-component system response regulator AtoC/two-component system nitrogen regulation response regulator NtrX